MSPSVSLIIASYNRSPFLAGAIEGVLKQSYTGFQLLIRDDGFTYLSPQIARYSPKRAGRRGGGGNWILGTCSGKD